MCCAKISPMLLSKERHYLIALLSAIAFLLLLSLVSFIGAIAVIYQTQTMNNNILELIYMGMHIIILVTALLFTKNALPHGSYVMRNLMYSRYGQRSRGALIISAFFTLLGLAVFVYFGLVFLGVDLPSWHFPIALILDLINVGLTLTFFGLFFFLFPWFFPYRSPTATEGEKNEGSL